MATLPRGALARLRRSDPRMEELIRRVGRYRLDAGNPGGHLGALIRSIVYQQLSGKAAATIHGRFAALFAEATFPDAVAILAKRDEELRACGLSRQKIAAVRDLCSRVASGTLPLEAIESFTDDAALAHLTQVRGIGRWSAEMFFDRRSRHPEGPDAPLRHAPSAEQGEAREARRALSTVSVGCQLVPVALARQRRGRLVTIYCARSPSAGLRRDAYAAGTAVPMRQITIAATPVVTKSSKLTSTGSFEMK